jgi:hypothetical protein
MSAREKFITKLRNMSDEDVFALELDTLRDHDHPFYDEIMNEADYRESVKRDNRVADAMGES